MEGCNPHGTCRGKDRRPPYKADMPPDAIRTKRAEAKCCRNPTLSFYCGMQSARNVLRRSSGAYPLKITHKNKSFCTALQKNLELKEGTEGQEKHCLQHNLSINMNRALVKTTGARIYGGNEMGKLCNIA